MTEYKSVYCCYVEKQNGDSCTCAGLCGMFHLDKKDLTCVLCITGCYDTPTTSATCVPMVCWGSHWNVDRRRSQYWITSPLYCYHEAKGLCATPCCYIDHHHFISPLLCYGRPKKVENDFLCITEIFDTSYIVSPLPLCCCWDADYVLTPLFCQYSQKEERPECTEFTNPKQKAYYLNESLSTRTYKRRFNTFGYTSWEGVGPPRQALGAKESYVAFQRRLVSLEDKLQVLTEMYYQDVTLLRKAYRHLKKKPSEQGFRQLSQQIQQRFDEIDK